MPLYLPIHLNDIENYISMEIERLISVIIVQVSDPARLTARLMGEPQRCE